MDNMKFYNPYFKFSFVKTMASLSTNFQARIRKAIELLSSPPLLSLCDDETLLSLEGVKIRLQDYPFTQKFTLLIKQMMTNVRESYFIICGIIKRNVIHQKLRKKFANVQIPRLFSYIAYIKYKSACSFFHVIKFRQL